MKTKKLMVKLTATAGGRATSSTFTRARRTDPAEVKEAIARGDFADARWLRCESQLALIAEAETDEDRRSRRKFIVATAAMFDVLEQAVGMAPSLGLLVDTQVVHLRGPGETVH